ASPVFNNCKIVANSASVLGGGMANQTGSPSLQNCTFRGNASSKGGGLATEIGSPELSNCTFAENSADSGGGVYIESGNPTLVNCLIHGNAGGSTSDDKGGGMRTVSGDPKLINCTFSANSAYKTGGVYCDDGADGLTLTNCILWGNTDIVSTGPEAAQIDDCDYGNVTYSCIQDDDPNDGYIPFGGASNNNVDDDPLFVDSGTNVRLSFGSPCINAGDDSALPDPPPLDLDGNVRVRCHVDMGPYELPVLFVDGDATGLNNGESWEDAFSEVQDALDAAASSALGMVEIWVAYGDYRPTNLTESGDPRSATFQLLDRVRISGGFAGTEACRDERDVEQYQTVLSGDLNGDDADIPCSQDSPDCDAYGGLCVAGVCIIKGPNSENCYHVVTAVGTDSTAMLDGVTVTGANANGQSPHWSGGGLYVTEGSPAVDYCTFERNFASQAGGGVLNVHGSPALTRCMFNHNQASDGGGLAASGNADTALVNSAFLGNSGGSIGGGVYNSGNAATLTNCIFSGNSAGSAGGGAYHETGTATLKNCSFSENSAGHAGGGGMRIAGGNATVANSIFWENADESGGSTESAQISGTADVTYTCIQGLDVIFGGEETNIGDDPLFLDDDGIDDIVGTKDDNLRLQSDSLCIDEGDNSALPADVSDLDDDNDTTEQVPFDLDDVTRLQCNVDMGAYESEWPGLDPPEVDPGFAGPLQYGTKNRYVSFVPGNAGKFTAIRITLTEFVNDDPEGPIGAQWWVGEPEEFCENSGKVIPPCPHVSGLPDKFMGATLECDEPHYKDYAGWHGTCDQEECVGGLKDGEPCDADEDCLGVLHVYGQATVPSYADDTCLPPGTFFPTTYEIQVIDERCDVEVASNFSVPLELTMSHWGDIVGNVDPVDPDEGWTPPDGCISVATDVTAALDKWKNLGPPELPYPAVVKARADLDWEIPNRRVDISDVTWVLDAFRGVPYPWGEPLDCP
ncbi:MAG: right-handed parallel beta-helix repeat-containing protein, partial [Phycisphaerales bacterium]